MNVIRTIVLFLIFSFSLVQAQLEVKLNYCATIVNDIERLVCYDDLQAQLQQMPQPTNVVPDDILEIIKRNAVNEWPEDYEMQVYEIDKQSEGYLEFANLNSIQNIPNEILSQIKKQAYDQWEMDYVMQMYEANQQIKAYVDISSMSSLTDVPANVLDKIKIDAANEWADDYTMQIYTINNQIEAYKKTQ